MATDHSIDTHTASSSSTWSGANEPFKASYGKLMMWYFLLSDAFTFSAFLIAYGTLRFSMPTWPVPDFVFSSLPGGIHHMPLVFVTIMTFVLIVSSVTMVRAVQEGHRENRKGVVFWMFLTILGGLTFLGCQAWEWTTLIKGENMTIKQNPFGTHTENGIYLEGDGHDIKEGDSFMKGQSYIIHAHDGHFKPLKFKTESGEIKEQTLGPKAFGALFFCITGFHGFHVFSGVVFLLIIMLNVASGIYAKRNNGYEMVEKIGLYWHFVDLVWVFVFLVFYLL
ncbi:MAG: cytochrome c oxidase subunit 3 [Saprospiraceae bacterium]|nr:cytochrome c oxidase subunit 3 [Candidatus Vicinibacter affinis]MBP6172283.1 cytochrome c oxidase subunit 3 [Saprospiraceae bacterium]MBK6572020.1 cytochrome c oxidase subunit 3 [Candidatus Vicinibacter affinis]MBK6823980.1 cytochrome c oxidase subunit 3 [Candidatus Vicinibacter affinis]MBK7305194.1 cytochrome c oxidase subunit 3 [Candidatus Vicinibacter affinis]